MPKDVQGSVEPSDNDDGPDFVSRTFLPKTQHLGETMKAA
jgi:hypothetical protein